MRRTRDSRALTRRAAGINVGGLERAASIALGSALLTRGLLRHQLSRAAMTLLGGGLLHRGITGHCHAYQALGMNTAEPGARRAPGAAARAPAITRSITIGKPADELQRVFRAPPTLAQIMGHFAAITAVGEDRLRWTVSGPRGRSLTWESRIVDDRPGELLRWESLAGAPVPNEGEVRFLPAPSGWGTEVKLCIRFEPPGGALGEALVKRFAIVPRMVAEKALRRFKSLVETGEIPTIEHQPAARSGGRDE